MKPNQPLLRTILFILSASLAAACSNNNTVKDAHTAKQMPAEDTACSVLTQLLEAYTSGNFNHLTTAVSLCESRTGIISLANKGTMGTFYGNDTLFYSDYFYWSKSLGCAATIMSAKDQQYFIDARPALLRQQEAKIIHISE